MEPGIRQRGPVPGSGSALWAPGTSAPLPGAAAAPRPRRARPAVPQFPSRGGPRTVPAAPALPGGPGGPSPAPTLLRAPVPGARGCARRGAPRAAAAGGLKAAPAALPAPRHGLGGAAGRGGGGG